MPRSPPPSSPPSDVKANGSAARSHSGSRTSFNNTRPESPTHGRLCNTGGSLCSSIFISALAADARLHNKE